MAGASAKRTRRLLEPPPELTVLDLLLFLDTLILDSTFLGLDRFLMILLVVATSMVVVLVAFEWFV